MIGFCASGQSMLEIHHHKADGRPRCPQTAFCRQNGQRIRLT